MIVAGEPQDKPALSSLTWDVEEAQSPCWAVGWGCWIWISWHKQGSPSPSVIISISQNTKDVRTSVGIRTDVPRVFSGH